MFLTPTVAGTTDMSGPLDSFDFFSFAKKSLKDRLLNRGVGKVQFKTCFLSEQLQLIVHLLSSGHSYSIVHFPCFILRRFLIFPDKSIERQKSSDYSSRIAFAHQNLGNHKRGNFTSVYQVSFSIIKNILT